MYYVHSKLLNTSTIAIWAGYVCVCVCGSWGRKDSDTTERLN